MWPARQIPSSLLAMRFAAVVTLTASTAEKTTIPLWATGLPESGSTPLPEIQLATITLPDTFWPGACEWIPTPASPLLRRTLPITWASYDAVPGNGAKHAHARATVALGHVERDRVVVDAALHGIGDGRAVVRRQGDAAVELVVAGDAAGDLVARGRPDLVGEKDPADVVTEPAESGPTMSTPQPMMPFAARGPGTLARIPAASMMA